MPIIPDHFISLDPTGNDKQHSGKYMIGYIHSRFGQLGDLPEKMKVFAENNNFKFSGPIYHTYLHDEVCIKDPTQYLSQVTASIIGI